MASPITVDLFQIPMLRNVGVEMLSRLIPISEYRRYGDGERICSLGEPAHHFFICQRGEVLSEQAIGRDISATVSVISPGSCFGWAALLPDATYRSDTTSQGDTECIAIESASMRQLMESDHEFGFHLYKAMCGSLVDRLFTRTDQLLQLLSLHPDLRAAIVRDE
ncbi:Crp/Fnr family transcriptional regulator [Megalodesulfovibrio paquesii]